MYVKEVDSLENQIGRFHLWSSFIKLICYQKISYAKRERTMIIYVCMLNLNFLIC